MKPQHQRGFALLELTLAMALALLMAVWGASRWMNEATDLASRASGLWMVQVRDALAQALVRDLGGWASGEPGVFANPLRPTLPELIRHDLLPAGFPLRAALGFGVQLWVLQPERCLRDACRLDALVLADAPLRTAGGQPDLRRLAPLLQAMGGEGGYARAGSIQGPQFRYANPLRPGQAAWLPGTAAALASAQSALDPRYVRVDDERDLRLRGSLSVAGFLKAGVATDGACTEEGAIMRAAKGRLLVCSAGKWGEAADSAFGGAFMAFNQAPLCRPEGGMTRGNPLANGDCRCPEGFIAVKVLGAMSRWPIGSGSPGPQPPALVSYICVRPPPGYPYRHEWHYERRYWHDD